MSGNAARSQLKGDVEGNFISPHILIVEDHPNTAEMLASYFEAQEYEVATVGWGEDALSFVEEVLPDLIILDIRLPDINGYEVCRRLRSQRRTKHVPIIFLTEKKERDDKLKGLGLGATDYITKPFDVQELRLRVRNALRRSDMKHPTHPVTGLPMSSLSDECLLELLEGSSQEAVLSVGLQGLNDFSATYGFVARDDVMRSVALILKHAVRENQFPGTFVGHLDTTNFFIVVAPEQAEQTRQALQTRLDEAITFFYPYADRQEGNEADLPLRVAIGVLRLSARSFEDLDGLKQALFEVQRTHSP